MEFRYLPLIKTTDAELKALSNLNPKVKSGILPIFELTRSRRSTLNPQATVDKRVEQIKEIIEKNPFILDLTTEDTLSNTEIASMLECDNGFSAWCKFVKRTIQIEKLNAIPVIHYNPFAIADVKKEINTLKSISPTLAFRVGVDEEDLMSYLETISSVFDISNLILILDAEFQKLTDTSDTGDRSGQFAGILTRVQSRYSPKGVVCIFSSFPSSVNDGVYGNFGTGDFLISEAVTHEKLLSSFKDILYGDYGSIHPKRYNAFGKWIPRIDNTYNKSRFYYYRQRREEGGYIEAAKKLIKDRRYQKIKEFDTWGDEEIVLAAEGTPTGRAPSHWIAVRVNNYITMQYLRVRRCPHMSL